MALPLAQSELEEASVARLHDKLMKNVTGKWYTSGCKIHRNTHAWKTLITIYSIGCLRKNKIKINMKKKEGFHQRNGPVCVKHGMLSLQRWTRWEGHRKDTYCLVGALPDMCRHGKLAGTICGTWRSSEGFQHRNNPQNAPEFYFRIWLL